MIKQQKMKGMGGWTMSQFLLELNSHIIKMASVET